MYLKELTLTNFCGHTATNIKFHPGTNLIRGPMDSGKSTLFYSLAFILTPGSREFARPQSDIATGENFAEVTLRFVLNTKAPDGSMAYEEEHELRRVLVRKETPGLKNGYFIDGEEVKVGEKLNEGEVRAILSRRFGLPSPKQLIPLFWLRQLNLDYLIRSKATHRLDDFRDLFGYQVLDDVAKLVEKERKAIIESANEIRSKGTDTSNLQAELNAINERLAGIQKLIAEKPSIEFCNGQMDAINRWILLHQASLHTAKVTAAVASLESWLQSYAEHHRKQTVSLGENTILATTSSVLRRLNAAEEKVSAWRKEFPFSPEEIERALTFTMADERLSALNGEVDTVVKDFPAELTDWIRSLRSGKEAPTTSLLSGLVAIRKRVFQTVEKANAFARQLTHDSSKVLASLRYSIAKLSLENASLAADKLIVSLPECFREWARDLRQELTTGVPPAGQPSTSTASALIERNSVARKNIEFNNAIKSAEVRLSRLLGDNPPDKDMRLKLTDYIDTNGKLQDVSRKLGIPPTMDLKAALEAAELRPVALLADKVPASDPDSSSAEIGNWSPRAEQALKILWAEIDQHKASRCPLTGDEIVKDQLLIAKNNAAVRAANTAQSTAWQAFNSTLETTSPDLAAQAKAGDIAGVLDAIRLANTKYRAVIGLGVDENAAFWTNAALRSSYEQLRNKWTALGADIKEVYPWLVRQIKATNLAPATLMAQIASASAERERLGEPRDIPFEPFDDTTARALLAVNNALINEASLAEQLAATPQPERLQDWQEPTELQKAISLRDEWERIARTIEQNQAAVALAESDWDRTSKRSNITSALPLIDLLATSKTDWIPVMEKAQNLILSVIDAQARVQNASVGLGESIEGSRARANEILDRIMVKRPVVEKDVVSLRSKLQACSRDLSILSSVQGEWRNEEGFLLKHPSGQMLLPVVENLAALPTDRANALISSFNETIALIQEERRLNLATPSLDWNDAFGAVPVSLDLAEARLLILKKQIEETERMKTEFDLETRSAKKIQAQIDEYGARAAEVARLDEKIGAYHEMEKWLGKDGGIQVLASQQYLAVVARANEILDAIGAGMYLKADEDFELYQVLHAMPDIDVPASKMGGGRGNLCGIALGIAMLEYYNEVSGQTSLDFIVIDEPTICVEKTLVSSLLRVLSSNGRRKGCQTIIAEHEPSCESFVDNMITLEARSSRSLIQAA